jgi:hypothetical protein
MGKGGTVRANLQATRAQINNASASAQTRAFKARQIAKQKRDTEERKLRATQAAADKAKAATTTPTTTERDVSAESADDEDATPSAPTE